ncbi:MAG: aspartate kinase [Janthinobacterium lividum]
MEELTNLQVYKFGGASVKDAAAILNLKHIVETTTQGRPLLIVVSAMGKTTNALEEIFELAYKGLDYTSQLATLEAYHHQVSADLSKVLLPSYAEQDPGLVNGFKELAYRLANLSPNKTYDEGYDQVICFGEFFSSYLVYFALGNSSEGETYWRESPIITDATWREGKVNWQETEKNVQKSIGSLFTHAGAFIVVTEGFVGQVSNNHRITTLGREGSDYTAAILAYCLHAESVTIWKDVAGLLNADPKYFADTVRYPEISYQETIEMAYYGASVIHPKTLKPLADRGIPLRVKSFVDPTAEGTLIHNCQHPPLAPAFIRKAGQCLISFASRDFAFISEENLEVIFGALAQTRLKINLMQNSAISFSVCVDYTERRLETLLALVREQFHVQYNTGLTLFTIKNYDRASIERLTAGRTLLLEQRTRSTFQFLVQE